MKNIDKQNTSQATAKPAPQEKWLSKDGIVAVPKSGDAPDAADTVQEAVHQVMPKADVPRLKTGIVGRLSLRRG